MALGNGGDSTGCACFSGRRTSATTPACSTSTRSATAGLPDDLTPALDRRRAASSGTCITDSPYEFGVLPVDVLGQVYEQFLGKVIRLTEGHRAVIEEKPEVRKAGGVYYTPKYIVDYIVEHTLGKLLEGKRPGPRGGASKLRIVDPACGSGSFLIGAYEPDVAPRPVRRGRAGEAPQGGDQGPGGQCCDRRAHPAQ